MKKLILIIVMLFAGIVCAHAQINQNARPDDNDIILLDRKTHESIRKDLEDYKILLNKYKFLEQELYIFQKKYDELVAENEKVSNDLTSVNLKFASVTYKYDRLMKDTKAMQDRINYLETVQMNFDKMMTLERNKRYRAERFSRHSMEWKVGAVGLGVLCGVLIVQTSTQ